MAQADPPKEASIFGKLNGRSQLFFSNKMTRYRMDDSKWSFEKCILLPLQKI